MDDVLDVLACAPTQWDLAPPALWPRTPGGVIIARAPDGQLRCCAGYLPCGTCDRCRIGLHLACSSPLRPGHNHPGGMAPRVHLPPRFLAPLSPAPTEELAHIAALLAAGGPTYQAAVMTGMAPGDTVLVFGHPGPGALPLRLLTGLGLRALYVCPGPAPQHLPPEVTVVPAVPPTDDLPSPRCHLLDLAPSSSSLESWGPVAQGCLSCTLLGASPPPALRDCRAILGGQAVLRWVRDIHPHLVLDVVALGRRLNRGGFDTLGLGGMVAALDALDRGTGASWPVWVNSSAGVDSPLNPQ